MNDPMRDDLALARLVRNGQLDANQRELLIALLLEISATVRVMGDHSQRIPDTPEVATFAARCWEAISAMYTELAQTVESPGLSTHDPDPGGTR